MSCSILFKGHLHILKNVRAAFEIALEEEEELDHGGWPCPVTRA